MRQHDRFIRTAQQKQQNCLQKFELIYAMITTENKRNFF